MNIHKKNIIKISNFSQKMKKKKYTLKYNKILKVNFHVIKKKKKNCNYYLLN